ncbi:hypothetical protein FHX92_000498 [Clostridium saccharobutylicum]|nr:hypothetical protein [Clostridium saccharobutylicum]NYD01307.1 hypothetical protein [Clostridium saccharobutylicum]
MLKEHAGMGTISVVRNPHPNYVASEQKNSPYFG